ncbi:putative alcohol dehydrogenaselike domain-containing protein [Diaporthe ampelina]|uniref:Putative alcohol dehydrogenaselike domain-containing protein n=1 Tax=Diaporthe ampelina TaxID=1214573 RepID=A0A0G2FLI5_9PEZI|nr:putative alcohol dehydrogenaselike domain-containing protein [Diaporthe ampelina]
MATQTVRASVLHAAKDLRVEERTIPTLQPTEVLVAVKSTGLCGSDLHYYSHYRNGDIQVRQPMTLGHESAGTVTAVGSGVTGLKPGDNVALEVGLPCGECKLCAGGRYNICRAMSFRSSAKSFPHAQGTLQEQISHPAAYCHKLPEGVPLELGALAEPLSVALHAGDRARLDPGATVLVLGAGAVGLLCCAVSKVLGARNVVVADINADRVRWAVDRGFADASVVVPMKRPDTVEAKLEFAREVAALVAGAKTNAGEAVGEVDATFECTGVESCLQAAIYVGGKILIIGMGNPIQTLPISAASLKEVDLVGVFRYANTYPRVIELLAGGNPKLPPVAELITHRYDGLDSIPEAFGMAGKVKDDKGDLVLKVMVNM